MLLKDALRCSLFFLLLTSSYAFSQEDEEESASDDGTEEVVVTGSRIKRSNFETNAPVTVITSEDIENRGYNQNSSFKAVFLVFSRYLQRIPP